MKTRLAPLALAALLAVPAMAQQPPANRPPQPPPQPMAQMQEMHRHMEQLMLQLKETNEWMVQAQVREQYRLMGAQMEQAGDRLREMLRQMDMLHKDPALLRDQDRLRDMDRLRDRLRDMTRDLDQAHVALRKLAGKP
ncbi:MAG: hypothetical protein AB7S39_15185 [Gemmatimonadales bacterium]